MQGQNQYVGSFLWPFVRYDVLMPQQIRTDLFEWLYLSLVVHQNEQRGLDKKSYTKEVKDDVRHMIKQKFSSLLDDIVIDNIILMAEKEFTIKINTRYGSGEILIDETFSFLDTYEDLFSSQVTVQRVFQDGICGGVVPCFKEDIFIKDAKQNDNCELRLLVKDKPTLEQIKKAYLLFNRLSTIASNQDDALDETEEFYDEDAEVDFAPEKQDFETTNAEENKNTMSNFSTHFIENSRCEFKLEISVYSDGDKLYIDTPFDSDVTLKWMNKRLPQVRSVCEELDKYFKGLESKYITTKVDGNNDNLLLFVHRKGIADQLTKCGDIYRLIEHLSNKYDDLKKLLIDVDKQFASKHKSYFNSLGNYLECLIAQIVDRTDIQMRKYYDYNQYCTEINYICKQLGVSARPFLSETIFNHWKKGWKHFKADLASIFLANKKMQNNAKLYASFVQDMFDLYDSRNNGSHYQAGKKYSYESDDITKLFDVTIVLIELI